MQRPSPQELLERARAGDSEALGELLDVHGDLLNHLARRHMDGRLNARLSAADIVQQTCLSAIRHFDDFRGQNDAQFVAWLKEVHERNVRDVVRKHVVAQKRAVSAQEPLNQEVRDPRARPIVTSSFDLKQSIDHLRSVAPRQKFDLYGAASDFGLARVYETSRMSGITMHGEIGGSLAFSPPEHLTDYRNATPLGDLYSVAATLYNLLSRQFVYDFPDSVAKAVLMMLQAEPIPLRQRCPDLPEALLDVVDQCLARDASERLQTASEMSAALSPFR